MRSLLMLCLLLSLAFSKKASGDAGTENLTGSWFTLTLNGALIKDTPWKFSSDLSLRVSEQSSSLSQSPGQVLAASIIRPGIGYKFDGNLLLYVGYLYQASEPPYSSRQSYENRLWQQLQYPSHLANGGEFLNRIRLEQRSVTHGTARNWRWRQNIRWTQPYNDNRFFVLSEELFYNLNSVPWGPKAGFDQNRFFIGQGYHLSKHSSFEVGYLNNYQQRHSRANLQVHALALNLSYNIH
jgi:hypothetical protein